MRLVLIGYGKMGKMIEEVAVERGHTIVVKIDKENESDFNQTTIAQGDVAIEFTAPHSAFENVKRCIDFGIPVISGSTGWNKQLDEMRTYCLQNGGAFLHASNFSIGVNIFFEINQRLAKLMAPQTNYAIQLTETHHTQKLDKPSGTAVTLAEGILANNPHKQAWTIEKDANPSHVFIDCKRIDPAPGTHTVSYTSPVDTIEITHTAHNRKGFALGAVLAAEFIFGKKGVFNMKDVLGL